MLGVQFLAREHGFFDLYRTGFQKLGCFNASGSALSEVVPSNAFGHGLSLL